MIRLDQLDLDLPDLREELEKRARCVEEAESLRERIRLAKSRVRHSRAAVEERARKTRRVAEVAAKLRAMNAERRARLPEFAAKVVKIAGMSAKRGRALRADQEACGAKEKKLAAKRVAAADQVARCLYPVELVEPQASSNLIEDENDFVEDDDDEMGISRDLLDAMETSYVNGEWVNAAAKKQEKLHAMEAGREKEAQYKVVAPLLPSSGDYAAYITWTQTAKEFGDLGGGDDGNMGGASGDQSVTNPAHAVSAGLMFLSHACLHLATVLDVVLPPHARPSPRDFGQSQLIASEFRFGRRVARLNLGVFLLCLSQGVAPERLEAGKAAANMAALYELIDETLVNPDSPTPVGRVYTAWTGRQLLAAEAAGADVAEYLDTLPRRAEDEEEEDGDGAEGVGGAGVGLHYYHEEGWDFVDSPDLGSGLELDMSSSSPPPPAPSSSSSIISGVASSLVSSLWAGTGNN